MKCGKIIASKAKLAQSIQDKIKPKANCTKAITQPTFMPFLTFYTHLQSSVSACTPYLEGDVLLPRYLNSIHVKMLVCLTTGMM